MRSLLKHTPPASASEIRDALGITESDIDAARRAIESSITNAAAGGDKMTERLIIDNRADIPMSEALEYAIAVVKMGRISGGGESYCYVTTFRRGDDDVVVVANRNKRSDRLLLYVQEREAEAHNEEN